MSSHVTDGIDPQQENGRKADVPYGMGHDTAGEKGIEQE
jgi:hypothetical protein